MRLISSREAVHFLSQAAPRPWVQRLLRCMVLDHELPAYSTKGKVQASGTVFDMIHSLFEKAGRSSGPELDALIRESFDADVAAKLVGRELLSRYDEEPIVWTEAGDPVQLDTGFFIFATDIDLDAGILLSEFIPYESDIKDIFFPGAEDLLGSEMTNPNYEVVIEGLSFEFSKIELLLPSMQLGEKMGFTIALPELQRRVGRPPKWGWEAALAFVTSLAQTPDGLPTGQGAQARIEDIMRDWFLAETDEAPAPSQVRQRAAKIMQMIEMPKRR